MKAAVQQKKNRRHNVQLRLCMIMQGVRERLMKEGRNPFAIHLEEKNNKNVLERCTDCRALIRVDLNRGHTAMPSTMNLLPALSKISMIVSSGSLRKFMEGRQKGGFFFPFFRTTATDLTRRNKPKKMITPRSLCCQSLLLFTVEMVIISIASSAILPFPDLCETGQVATAKDLFPCYG